MNNKMSESIDFSLLNIPLPEMVKQYQIEKQQEIYEYLTQMDEHHKQAYLIAYNHLGSSFNIYKSNGFKEWKGKK
jgi:predicted deacetylase